MPFPNSVCSLCVSTSHFGNFHNISNVSIIAIFDMVPVTGDYDSLTAQMMVSVF